ncbi:MAG: hypothetical protein ABJB74_15315 [Gemmatimonas sp.]
MAGSWVNGALAATLADDVAQRNALIAAFRVAANAATSVSKSLAKKGDANATRYYASKQSCCTSKSISELAVATHTQNF